MTHTAVLASGKYLSETNSEYRLRISPAAATKYTKKRISMSLPKSPRRSAARLGTLRSLPAARIARGISRTASIITETTVSARAVPIFVYALFRTQKITPKTVSITDT